MGFPRSAPYRIRVSSNTSQRVWVRTISAITPRQPVRTALITIAAVLPISRTLIARPPKSVMGSTTMVIFRSMRRFQLARFVPSVSASASANRRTRASGTVPVFSAVRHLAPPKTRALHLATAVATERTTTATVSRIFWISTVPDSARPSSAATRLTTTATALSMRAILNSAFSVRLASAPARPLVRLSAMAT